MWHGCSRCLLCFKRAPRLPSHARTLLRVGTLSSQGFVPLEGSAYLARNRAIKCYAVGAVISRRGCAFLGVAAARARSGRRGQADVTAVTVPAILRRDDGLFAVAWPPRSWWGPPVGEKERFPAVNARGTSAPESSPAAYKSEGREKRRFFTLAFRRSRPLCSHLRFALAVVRLRH
jgi:hypothetical protein